jgi:PHD/YefM family antitoxin component YafN of YafNO toxin-antitoxin module
MVFVANIMGEKRYDGYMTMEEIHLLCRQAGPGKREEGHRDSKAQGANHI